MKKLSSWQLPISNIEIMSPYWLKARVSMLLVDFIAPTAALIIKMQTLMPPVRQTKYVMNRDG